MPKKPVPRPLPVRSSARSSARLPPPPSRETLDSYVTDVMRGPPRKSYKDAREFVRNERQESEVNFRKKMDKRARIPFLNEGEPPEPAPEPSSGMSQEMQGWVQKSTVSEFVTPPRVADVEEGEPDVVLSEATTREGIDITFRQSSKQIKAFLNKVAEIMEIPPDKHGNTTNNKNMLTWPNLKTLLRCFPSGTGVASSASATAKAGERQLYGGNDGYLAIRWLETAWKQIEAREVATASQKKVDLLRMIDDKHRQFRASRKRTRHKSPTKRRPKSPRKRRSKTRRRRRRRTRR